MAQKKIYELEGVVSMEDKNALRAIKRLAKESTKLRDLLKVKGDTRQTTQEYQILGRIIDTTRARVEALQKEQNKLRRSNIQTDEYKQLKKDAMEAEKAVENLNTERRLRESAGITAAQDKQLLMQIEEAKDEARMLNEELERVAQTGTSSETAKQFFRLNDAIKAATNDLRGYESAQAGMESSGRAYEASNAKAMAARVRQMRQAMAKSGGSFFGKKDWNATPISRGLLQVRDRLLAIISATKPARAAVTRFISGAVNDTKSFAGWLGMLKSGFGSVFQRLKMFPGLQTKVGNRFGFIAKHANKMKRGLMMGAGIRGLVRLGAAGAIALYSIRMMKEGMANLIQYDGQTANSINMLKASLDTLRNALATAFAPILNAVAPMLNTMINMLVRAATAVAHFTAAITGQKSVVVAKKATSGYTSAVGDAAKGSKKASKAAKEYQRTLMGFDQINKLEDKDKSGAGAGGAGGGAGGGVGSMFETVPIDSQISAFADKIKEAWKKGDFTEIGAILANKINGAMEAIPWGKINATAKKIATSIGTFINGFVETFNWKLLAKTISNGILVAMNFLSTLLETIHWQSIGKAIVDFITGIKWGALFKGASRLAGNLLGALAGVFAGVAKSVGKRAKKYFAKYMKGGHVVSGFLKGIANAIKEIGGWIKKNIFKPFIDGFKKAFGISSPSKKMEEQGGYMIDGLLGGLKNKLDDVLGWFADLPGKIMEKIGDKLSVGIDLVGNLVGDTWDTIKNISGKALEYTAEQAGNVWSAITGIAGKTLKYIAEKAGDVWGAITGIAGKTLKYAAEKAGDVWGKITGMAGKTLNYYADKAGKTWGSISGMAGKTLNYYAAQAGKVWKKIKDMKGKTLNFTAKFIGKAWNLIKSLVGKKAEGGVYSSGRWHPVQSYADGGYPRGSQMFVAREAGPELVGTIGGNTAVMNNDQIVASVAAGVAQAVAGVMGSGSNDVNVYLQGDAGTFFRVMRQKANDYTRATGQPAFPV